MLPTEEFLEACRLFEHCFHQFHRKPDVLQRLFIPLENKFKDNWPSDVLMLYARVRTFIRIKALNCKLKLAEGDSVTRKFKQIAQHIS